MGGRDQEREHGQGRGGAQGGGQGQGQSKTHTITHPTEGEREVTQQEWRTNGRQLRENGWTRVDVDTEGSVDETTGGTESTDGTAVGGGEIASTPSVDTQPATEQTGGGETLTEGQGTE